MFSFFINGNYVFYINKRVKLMINLMILNLVMIFWSIISGYIFCFFYIFIDYLMVNIDGIYIVVEDVWGVLRGLEILS